MSTVSETKAIQIMVTAWSARTFPEQAALSREDKARNIICKIRKELEELEANPAGEDEFADMDILLAELAEIYGHDRLAAMVRKMSINYSRTWERQPDGTYQHVEVP